MGSIVTIKDQLEHQAQAWREVLAKIIDLDPSFVTRYATTPAKEAVLLELERFYSKELLCPPNNLS